MSMLGPIEIPNKSSFKSNEVCALTGVKSYVLRFWESEFEEISPLESSSGQRLYEYRDIEAILLIKKLLFDDKLTIERAKAQMKTLMPRESLVEESFTDNVEMTVTDDFYEKNFAEVLENFKPAAQAAPLVKERVQLESNLPINLRESLATRVLVDSDFQKLMKAKSLLQSMISRIELIQEKKNWC